MPTRIAVVNVERAVSAASGISVPFSYFTVSRIGSGERNARTSLVLCETYPRSIIATPPLTYAGPHLERMAKPGLATLPISLSARFSDCGRSEGTIPRGPLLSAARHDSNLASAAKAGSSLRRMWTSGVRPLRENSNSCTAMWPTWDHAPGAIARHRGVGI